MKSAAPCRSDRALIEARYKRGVYLPEVELWLDPHGVREFAFVSHAHADHFARHKRLLCSERTWELILARYGKPKKSDPIVLPFGTPKVFGDYEITLLPAGHIFGSAQLFLRRKDGATLLYTGDFKRQEGLSSEAVESRHAEVLIMETTFGLPHFQFPPGKEVMKAIVKFCHESLEEGKIPIIAGYSLGKAQEVLKGLSDAKLPLMLHPTVAAMTEVYARILPNFAPEYEALDVTQALGKVLIAPPQVLRTEPLNRLANTTTAMLSGWALEPSAPYRYQVDRLFPLSDHADYPDLLCYVDEVQPKHVLTIHGYAAEFARDLRARGIEAWSLLSDNQMDLGLTLEDEQSRGQRIEQVEGYAGVGSFAQFCHMCAEIELTTGRTKQKEILTHYFTNLDEMDLPRAARFLHGQSIPDGVLSPPPLVHHKLLQRALLIASGISHARFREIARSQNNLSRTTQLVMQTRSTPCDHSLASLEVSLATLRNTRLPTLTTDLICDQIRKLHPRDAAVYVSLLQSRPPIILSEGLFEESLADAFKVDFAHVKNAWQRTNDPGTIALHTSRQTLAEIEFKPLLATPFTLSPLEEGIPCQLHCASGKVRLFSMSLHSIDARCHAILTQALLALETEVILTGELVIWEHGKKLTLSDLKRSRSRRYEDDLFQEIPQHAQFLIHDLQWMNGVTYLDAPMTARKAILTALKLPDCFSLIKTAGEVLS